MDQPTDGPPREGGTGRASLSRDRPPSPTTTAIPAADKALYAWARHPLAVRIPRRACCPEHRAPVDVFARREATRASGPPAPRRDHYRPGPPRWHALPYGGDQVPAPAGSGRRRSNERTDSRSDGQSGDGDGVSHVVIGLAVYGGLDLMRSAMAQDADRRTCRSLRTRRRSSRWRTASRHWRTCSSTSAVTATTSTSRVRTCTWSTARGQDESRTARERDHRVQRGRVRRTRPDAA